MRQVFSLFFLVFTKKKIEECKDANNLQFLYNTQDLMLSKFFSQAEQVYNESKLTALTV